MQSNPKITLLLLSLIAAAFAGPSLAWAQNQDLTIEQPHARITIPGRPAAGYMTIRNAGQQADALLSASSPLAGRIELHTHLMEGGIMKMRAIEKVDVPAGGTANFAPGGDHLMIFGLKEDVKPGGALPVTLTFRNGGKIEVDFEIGKIGQSKQSDKKAGNQHHHKH